MDEQILQTIREDILAFYNDDKGMIVSALARREARLEEERIKTERIKETRVKILEDAQYVLEAFVEIEGPQLFTFDTEATYTIRTETDLPEFVLDIPSIDSALVVSMNRSEIISAKWYISHAIHRQHTLMDVNGNRVSTQELLRSIMDILVEILDTFIEKHELN